MNISPEVIVEASSLSFSYFRSPVLKDVSFQVFSNEFIGIVGPNGGGKSTLLKLILGLLSPSQGQLAFSKAINEKRNEVGYVPQHLQFDRDFPITLKQMVLMGTLAKTRWYGGYSVASQRKAEHALLHVGLSAMSESSLSSLSGGQLQRGLIARAIVSQPVLLLLDEPTSSLDYDAQEEIYRILKDLSKTTTILMVTHDLKALIKHIGRVFLVDRTLSVFNSKDVCAHYSMGIYHEGSALTSGEENSV